MSGDYFLKESIKVGLELRLFVFEDYEPSCSPTERTMLSFLGKHRCALNSTFRAIIVMGPRFIICP